MREFVDGSGIRISECCIVGIFSIAALGLNIVVGFTGQISIGHAAFFGFGAFGRLTARHLSPWFDIHAHDPAATDADGHATLTDLAAAAA